jgi:hypothetical protein
MRLIRLLAALGASLFLLGTVSLGGAGAGTGETTRYTVVFRADYALNGTYALGGNYALNHNYALSLVKAAGGTVAADLSNQIGVMVVDSPNALFADVMRSYALVEEVGAEFVWKSFPSYREAIDSGALTVVSETSRRVDQDRPGVPAPTLRPTH